MNPNSLPSAHDVFPRTKWSVVRRAVSKAESDADDALNELCRVYDQPVLEYIERLGFSRSDAEDLKQAFFLKLLERDFFSRVDVSKGRLRAFLVCHLKDFLKDHFRYRNALKRGGGQVVLLEGAGEAQANPESVDWNTPFEAYQKRWLEVMSARVMARLRTDYAAEGRSELFECIAPYLTDGREERLADISVRMGRPVGTLKSDINRLKKRCAQLVEDEVAATLEEPTVENIRAELRELMSYK